MNTIHARADQLAGRRPALKRKPLNTRKYTMKKNISKALGIACVSAIFLACVVTNEAGDPFWANYALLALAAVTGLCAKRMEGRSNG